MARELLKIERDPMEVRMICEILIIGGSWMGDNNLIQQGKWERLEKLARECVLELNKR
jgi:2-keto-3-deoxy-6-phosphogluconate aldolase